MWALGTKSRFFAMAVGDLNCRAIPLTPMFIPLIEWICLTQHILEKDREETFWKFLHVQKMCSCVTGNSSISSMSKRFNLHLLSHDAVEGQYWAPC